MALVESSFRKKRQLTRGVYGIDFDAILPYAILPLTNAVAVDFTKHDSAVSVGEFLRECDAKAGRDLYAEHTMREQRDGYAGLTYEHPDNVRARRVAALREELSKPVQARFPHEGRSDRVYAENRR